RLQGLAFLLGVVATFLALLQVMTVVALSNVLHDGAAQRWGMAEPHLQALEALLHERAPRQVSTLHEPLSGSPARALQRRVPGLMREVVPGEVAVEPTHLLSNGRYSVALRPNGAGLSRRGTTGITRWRDDALRDDAGSFVFVRWPQPPAETATERAWGLERRAARRPDRLGLASVTQHPAPDPAAEYRCRLHADRVCFSAEWPRLHVHTTVWVSPEDDIEFRQVELLNTGARSIELELISALEVTLSEARADESHPAFMNLFVAAAWRPRHQALLFTRTPRLPSEPALMAAHFLADVDRGGDELDGPDAAGLRLRVQTDRQRWRGRNRGPEAPRAELDEPAQAADAGRPGMLKDIACTTGLDPVAALGVGLTLPPNRKVTLTFATAASDDAGQLDAIVDKYRQRSHIRRSSLMSATLAGI
ncbi:MAG: hypothetical protein ACOVQT_09825, partial [Rubrivivax sp.]